MNRIDKKLKEKMIDFISGKKNIASNLELDFSVDDNPSISVVIPVYRRPEIIKDFIISMQKQNMDCNNWEAVFVDDSNDESISSEIRKELNKNKELPIRYYVNQDNLGRASNWNRCIELARAESVLMIHTDDLLYSNTLNVINNLTNTELQEYALLFLGRDSCIYRFNDDIESLIEKKTCYKKVNINTVGGIDELFGTCANAPTGVVLKKTVFLHSGGFNNKKNDFPLDVDLVIRYLELNQKVGCISQTFFIKREGENDTYDSTEQYRINWIRSIVELFNVSQIIPINILNGFLFKMRIRDMASWGRVEVRSIGFDYHYNLFEVIVYRMMQKIWSCIKYKRKNIC